MQLKIEEQKWLELSEEEQNYIVSDFRNFLFMTWKHLGLPNPTPVQYDIAEYIQHSKRRTIVEAFRGVGKSWITSTFVCWLLLKNPQLKILVVSAAKDRADAFSTFTKRLMSEMPVLRHLCSKRGQRDSNVAFDVAPAAPDHAPSVKSVGVYGALAGTRADYIIADDIEIQNNSLTQLMRDRLSEAVKEFDAILKPNGYIKYLGTPQTEMSIYNVLEERGYEIRVWCSRYPKSKQRALYGNRLAPFICDNLDKKTKLANSKFHDKYGSPTDPDRFDEKDLLEREASYGRSGFALQFMLDTTISDADRYPLKLSDLMIMGTTVENAPIKVVWGSGVDQIINDIPNVGLAGDRLHRPVFVAKDFTEFTGACMFIDPSGTGTDETAYCVVKMLNGFLYVRRSGGFLAGYEDPVLKALAEIAKEEKVNFIGVEDNFGDGMFTKIFTPFLHKINYPVTIEGHKVTTQKEARIISTLEPVMNQHRLVIDEDVAKNDLKATDAKYQLFYQLTRVTKERGALIKDDRLDVLAQAVAYWTAQMDKDVDTIEEQHQNTLQELELKKFVESFGGRHKEPNWTDAL